ncbi:hypothetical protein L1F30_04160 [Simiduia sp. 21SJ11W-1]|uniref:hypothetical protein n=1 Tax=Simiduia sp. 21SJ11W-1 TaxID=2909669 RepID=UPI0020A1B74E|nr:hypothetical protein [Simiduia sp. 21SJ11W-1]UTA48742.1 hypothetical protein L1F30_04160 [Simiduia sp. 21SJ11W-1]
MSSLNPAGESEVYLFLLGMNAAAAADPVEAGRWALAESRKRDRDADYDIQPFPAGVNLPMPDFTAFCATYTGDCIKSLITSSDKGAALLQGYDVLLGRFEKFLSYDEYITLAKPLANEVFPPYQYLMAANRLALINALTTAKAGRVEQSTHALGTFIEKLHRHLALQDNLIGRMVFVAMLSDAIDVYSAVLQESERNTVMLDPLGEQAKRFHPVVAREFALVHNLAQEMDGHPELLQSGGNMPGFVSRWLFKPNMTLNALIPIYARMERLALLSPEGFAKVMETGVVPQPETSSWLNYLGHKLLQDGPEFDEYIARVHDLDVKISLFNQVHSLHRDVDELINPYSPKAASPASYQDGQVCMPGPLPDKRGLRCLWVGSL